MIHIRGFKALDDTESCIRFAEGHANVLKEYGVTKVTSSNTDWFYNPAVYVLIAEHKTTGEVLGGVRVHMADGVTPLPMEDAIAIVDTGVHDLIRRYLPTRTGELCGLWNSHSVAGIGLGSYFLMRAGISITTTLNMGTLFALCAPHTLRISMEKGFEQEKSIGNEGTFLYPKLDLVATSIIIKDLVHLPCALPEEAEIIHTLQKNPVTDRVETGPKGAVEVSYNLKINSPT